MHLYSHECCGKCFKLIGHSLLYFMDDPGNATFGGSAGMANDITHLRTKASRERCSCLRYIGSAIGSGMWAVGHFVEKSTAEGEKYNGNRYINHFYYSLAVEASFYSDAGKVVWRFHEVKQRISRLVPGWVTALLNFTS